MSVDIDQYCLRWCKESPSFNHIVFPSRKKRDLCDNFFFYYRKTKVTFIPYERSYTDLPLLANLTIGQQPNEICLNSNINLRCGNERFILLSHLLQMTLITRKWHPVLTINGRENNWYKVIKEPSYKMDYYLWSFCESDEYIYHSNYSWLRREVKRTNFPKKKNHFTIEFKVNEWWDKIESYVNTKS